jgi:hypothetical protein
MPHNRLEEPRTLPHATAALLNRIDSLLDGSKEPAQIERTLTDGYARALTLEAERLRIERRLDNRDDPETEAHELLDERLVAIDTELVSLRDRLAILRARSLELRAELG